jgi:hypothetical protein
MPYLASAPSSVPGMGRLLRFFGIAMLLCGAVLILVALGVFLTQAARFG